jgi:hypothetical protein
MHMIQAASFTLLLCLDALPCGPLRPSHSDTLPSHPAPTNPRPALPPISSGNPPPPPVWPPPCSPSSGPSRRPRLALPFPPLPVWPLHPSRPLHLPPHPVSPHVWPLPDYQAYLVPHKVNGWLNIYRFYLFSYVHTYRKSSLQFDNTC